MTNGTREQFPANYAIALANAAAPARSSAFSDARQTPTALSTWRRSHDQHRSYKVPPSICRRRHFLDKPISCELAHIRGLGPRLWVLPPRRRLVGGMRGKNENADSWGSRRLRNHRCGRMGDQWACKQQARCRVVPREWIHELRHQRWILRWGTRKTHQSWAAITETSKPATGLIAAAPPAVQSTRQRCDLRVNEDAAYSRR
jgi:hypothetical protein